MENNELQPGTVMKEFPNVPADNYNDIRNKIKSGDILLCSGGSLMSTIIKKATNSVWSHVAMIMRLEIIDRIMVMESVESIGVRTVPLSNYVRNYNATGMGYPGRLMLARHTDIQEQDFVALSQKAVDLLGYPYDAHEILRIVARISMEAFGFSNKNPKLLQDKEFICSEYVYICFQSIGITINYNKEGFIAPKDFARNPKIQALNYIATENQ